MVHITSFSFTKPFSVSYLRNNRSSGQKSLRCFPQCTERGHVASGFCGMQLEATATIEKNPDLGENWLETISVIGEIRPFSEQGISGSATVSRIKLMTELRDTKGSKASGELLLGEMKVISEDETMATVTIIFNAEKHSWDYSWKSNRWSGVNNSHVVDVILVESISNSYITDSSSSDGSTSSASSTDLKVYSSACGNTFLILSSHKSPHLKRKLSAAAANADAAKVWGEKEIRTITTVNNKAPRSYLLDVRKRSHERKINAPHDCCSSSDPLSALLQAFGDEDQHLDDNLSVLPLDHTSDSSALSASSSSFPSLSVRYEQEKVPLLPAKRRRVKSMKMKEYTESFHEDKNDLGVGENADITTSESVVGSLSPHGMEKNSDVGHESTKKKDKKTSSHDTQLNSLNSAGDALSSPAALMNLGGNRGDTDYQSEAYGDEDEYEEELDGEGEEGGELDMEEEYEYGNIKIQYTTVEKHDNIENIKHEEGEGERERWIDASSSSANGSSRSCSNDNSHPMDCSRAISNKEDLQSADSKIFDLRWKETFAELVIYCETFGHGNVPKDYKSAAGRWLGKWLDFQRQMKKKNRLMPDRKARLEGLVNAGYLNMYDGPRRDHRLSGENVHQWEGWYNALIEFGEINGHYNVPRHYVIPASTSSSSSITLFNTVGRKLGRWLQTQRLRKRSGDMRGDRLKRLQNLADTGKLDWLGKENSAFSHHLKEKEKEKEREMKKDIKSDETVCFSSSSSSSSTTSSSSSSSFSFISSPTIGTLPPLLFLSSETTSNVQKGSQIPCLYSSDVILQPLPLSHNNCGVTTIASMAGSGSGGADNAGGSDGLNDSDLDPTKHPASLHFRNSLRTDDDRCGYHDSREGEIEDICEGSVLTNPTPIVLNGLEALLFAATSTSR